MKIILTEQFENKNNLTECIRFDPKGAFNSYKQSAYLIDFERLEYVIKLLNGDLTIKLELFAERDYFLINTIFNLVAKLRRKKGINYYSRYTEKNKDIDLMQKVNF